MTDDIKVTLRMGAEEVRLIDDFVEENPDIGNRSNLIRAAIRAYVSEDSPIITNIRRDENGIFIRFSELHMAMLTALKNEGICFSEEEYVRNLVLSQIIPEEGLKKTTKDAFDIAQTTLKWR